jgi:DNA-binding NtrC family response regulator
MHRILIVDDERILADTLGMIFRRNGFKAQVTYTADEALASARVCSPDLLLCDISMPGRTGLDLMADIGREMPDCRVLVLTGHYSNLLPVQEQSRKMPRPSCVLTKPCNPDELLRQAGQLLATA